MRSMDLVSLHATVQSIRKHKTKLYSFCHNRNLLLAIEETMVAIVRKMQLFCLSNFSSKRTM